MRVLFDVLLSLLGRCIETQRAALLECIICNHVYNVMSGPIPGANVGLRSHLFDALSAKKRDTAYDSVCLVLGCAFVGMEASSRMGASVRSIEHIAKEGLHMFSLKTELKICS